MVKPYRHDPPVVSVIIPCHNHGTYLGHAIASVLAQDYHPVEILVVDDGSVDQTKKVCSDYPTVNYYYQKNSGLSAARNKGIMHAKGDFMVFLDADDWLLDGAITKNLHLLLKNNHSAFVSGAHRVYHEETHHSFIVQEKINENHYQRLLEGNYIGMHATVMYRRWVFDEFIFDTSLAFCEDYDLYLKIARKYPVLHHTELIAVYRRHTTNMSANYPAMLNHVLLVLERNEKHCRTPAEKKSKNLGMTIWKNYYSQLIVDHLREQLATKKSPIYRQEIETLKAHSPKRFLNFKRMETSLTLSQLPGTGKKWLKKWLPPQMLEMFRNIIKRSSQNSRPGTINLGDFNRTAPFSTQFGYDRGGPIDRYYIEYFLNEHSPSIAGNVLEIGDNSYTLRFGGGKVKKSDILHIDASNDQATYIGDLSNAPHLPSDSFDCILLTQTLHLIYDYNAAIATCYRILKPGGRLLLTVPGISHIAQDQWGKYWLWSFTGASMQKIMQEQFHKEKITINTYGNVLVASAFLYGMGLPEMKKKQLDYHDPHFQLIISASAVK